MKLIDTVVLFAGLDRTHKEHKKAHDYLKKIKIETDLYTPSEVLIEFDLELKAHGTSEADRIKLFATLEKYIDERKTLPVSIAASIETIGLEKEVDYFDARMAGLARIRKAVIISTDSIFDEIGLSREW